MWSVILSIIRKLSLFILLSIILKPPRLERYGNTFFSTNVYWAFEKEKYIYFAQKNIMEKKDI